MTQRRLTSLATDRLRQCTPN